MVLCVVVGCSMRSDSLTGHASSIKEEKSLVTIFVEEAWPTRLEI